MPLCVLSPGPLTTIQDMGRFGYERFGVPQSGAMDWFALRAANALVGNPLDSSEPGAAALEFALEAPILQASEDCLVAAAGRGYALYVQSRPVGLWRAALVRRGEKLSFSIEGRPGWGYLAVLGGIDVPPVMGSRSTYLRGGFGGWHGRAIREGDALPVHTKYPRGWKERAGRWLPPEKRPEYSDEASIPVIAGPQEQAFTAEARGLFYNKAYNISSISDRMGYRLAGPCLAHRNSADLISEPLAWGAVQVPADGMPMAMMSDRPTTGGYPKIATAARAGLPLLAQAMPGSGQVCFRRVSIVEAQRQYRRMMTWIETGIEGEEDALSS